MMLGSVKGGMPYGASTTSACRGRAHSLHIERRVTEKELPSVHRDFCNSLDELWSAFYWQL